MFALDDYTLLKYLKARDFDVKRASKILYEHLEFRRNYRPEELTLASPGVFEEALPMGTSLKGNAVLAFRVRTYNPSMYTKESFLVSRVYEVEQAHRRMALAGWKSDRIMCISDLGGYRLLKHANPHALYLQRQVLEVFQTLYRDKLEAVLIVNSPAVFQGIWSLMRGWFKPETAKRVVFINDFSELQQYIAPEEIYKQ